MINRTLESELMTHCNLKVVILKNSFKNYPRATCLQDSRHVPQSSSPDMELSGDRKPSRIPVAVTPVLSVSESSAIQTPATSTPVLPQTEVRPLRDHSPIPQAGKPHLDDETPRKSSKSRPTVPPKPEFNRDSRAASEPTENPLPGVLSGGEHISLPPQLLPQQTSNDSPMPELLSLKDRLKLFEAEIEQQHKDPEPRRTGNLVSCLKMRLTR